MTQRADNVIQLRTDQVLLWVVRSGILLVLIMPLIVTSSTLFPFIVGKAIFSRSMIEATVAVWIVLAIYYPQYRPARSWIIIAFAIWVLISLISGLTGVSPTRSLWSTYERMQGIIDLAHWLGFTIVAGSVFRTFADWRLLFTLNLGISAVVSFLGLGQDLGLFESALLGKTGRIESTLGNATYVGAYTMVNSLLGVAMLFHSFGRSTAQSQTEPEEQSRAARRRRRRSRRESTTFDYVPWLRAFWIGAILINVLVLWLSGTRGAVIGLGGGAVAFSVVYSVWGQVDILRKAAYLLLIGVIGLLVMFIVIRTTSVLDPVVNSSTMLQRISSIGFDDQSIHGRVVSIGAGLEAYVDRPIFGWGPENYLVAWGRYFDAESGVRERFDQAHNKLIEELTTKGALGFLSYMTIWLAMAWVIIRSFRRRESFDQLFVALVGATLVAYFVQNLFLFDTPATVMQFCILTAFVIAQEGWLRTQQDTESEGEDSPYTGWLPQSWSQRLDFSATAGLLRSVVGGTILVILVAAVLIPSFYFLNLKPFWAAEAVVQTSNPNLGWADRLAFFDESIEEFPGLANYPRLLLISQASNNLMQLSDAEFLHAVDLVAAEGADGLEAEPENWRIEIALARFYQIAAQRNLEYLKQARVHVDNAFELAPTTREIIAIKGEQERIEEIVGSG